MRGGSWASEPIEPPLVCAVRCDARWKVQRATDRVALFATLSVSSYLNCPRGPAAPTGTRLFIVDAGVNEQRRRLPASEEEDDRVHRIFLGVVSTTLSGY